MKLLWRQWSLKKYSHWILKLGVAILLSGLAFRLFLSQSSRFEPELESSFFDKTELPQNPPVSFPNSNPTVTVDAPNPSPLVDIPNPPAFDSPKPSPSADLALPENETPQNGRCDLLIGDWAPNPTGPIYTNASCLLIEGHQNCMRNGRPDNGYLYWRWKPRDCELPPFDAGRFLDLMRNKKWALIGDSISRNHVQSLLCMLSTVEEAVEVYHDAEYRSKGWHFPSYNFTVSNIWSPFLVQAAIFEDYNGVSSSEVQLQLDKLDKNWTDMYQSLDYIIISTGKWFLKAAIYYENETAVGCHICPGRNLTELGFDFAYKKALEYAMDFIVKSKHKGLIFFRTSTPDHFENGEWHNGGTCPRQIPAKEGEVQLKDVNNILRNIELAEFEKASEKANENGVNLKLLDFTQLLLLRPDGHPGPYREFHPFAENKNKNKTAKVQNDCLHWCLPGPIDNLNDVIMEMAISS